jgi:hypothetical protein
MIITESAIIKRLTFDILVNVIANARYNSNIQHFKRISIPTKKAPQRIKSIFSLRSRGISSRFKQREGRLCLPSLTGSVLVPRTRANSLMTAEATPHPWDRNEVAGDVDCRCKPPT